LKAPTAARAERVRAFALQLSAWKRNPLVISGLQDFRGVIRHTRAV
jgi:hypothetical protein